MVFLLAAIEIVHRAHFGTPPHASLKTQVPVEQSLRLRTLLPNGATILVQNRPGAKSLNLDLFVSSAGTEESPTTNGRRHLLEHLVALGNHENLDTRLESAAGFLTARTFRDVTTFEVSLPPSKFALGLEVLKELLTPRTYSAASILRETHLIEEEAALRSDSALASQAAWSVAYEDKGLDPIGNPDVMAHTDATQLGQLFDESFSGNHLTVVVSGDIDLDQATASLKSILAVRPTKPHQVSIQAEPSAKPGSVSIPVSGQYRAIPVEGIRSPFTAASLAVALAVATESDNGEVLYTPSGKPGLIILGGAKDSVKSVLTNRSATQLFDEGRLLALYWISKRMLEQESETQLRGMLLAHGRDFRPEILRENLEGLTFREFARAYAAFRSSAILVEGDK
jgi:Insulinase (Peptidase family M16)